MSKEYITPFPDMPEYRVPRLYTVSCSWASRYRGWLNDNCKDRYYVSAGLVQFEDTEDAILFSLIKIDK